MGNPIVIEPSIERVRSGKVSKPTKVYVTTTLMEFQPDNESITIRTAWEIDYELRELRYIAGLLEFLTVIEPLLPWRVPDRHLRAARSVAAAALGMKRFRRPVRMYEPYEKDHLFVASYKKKRILLQHKEDAIIWGRDFADHPKVEKLPLDTAARLFDLPTQSAIELAQRNSMIQKSTLYIIQQRWIFGKRAEREDEVILQRGYPATLASQFTWFIDDIKDEMRKKLST